VAQANSPTLAAAAEILSRPLQTTLRRLARRLQPHLSSLQAELARRLRESSYDARQRKALEAISSLAAARILAAGRPLAAFFEQVDYNGRRLAKLDLTPTQILRELRSSGRRLDGWLARSSPEEAEQLSWARRQLEFATALALNNAFYQVREAESAAFHALFQAELAAHSHSELVLRCLQTLVAWSRAEAAWLLLRAPDHRAWFRAGVWPGHSSRRRLELPREVERRLARPRYLRCTEAVWSWLPAPRKTRPWACCWSVPLLRGSRLMGVLQLAFRKPYPWFPREVRLLMAAGERILEASEKARMSEELARREGEIRRLAERMVHVEALERQRISQELHDEAGQSLLCLRLQLEMLERKAAPANAELAEALAETRSLLERTIEDLRRLVADLSPAVLESLGLPAAVRRLVSRFRRLHGIRTQLRMELGRRLPKQLERVVYRLVQECLNNAGRHSQADHLNILLRADDNCLRLRVKDDGVGFTVPKTLTEAKGFGLAGMQERVALLGGRIQILSRPMQGTTVAIELPIPPVDCEAAGQRDPSDGPPAAGRPASGAPRDRKGERENA